MRNGNIELNSSGNEWKLKINILSQDINKNDLH